MCKHLDGTLKSAATSAVPRMHGTSVNSAEPGTASSASRKRHCQPHRCSCAAWCATLAASAAVSRTVSGLGSVVVGGMPLDTAFNTLRVLM